MKLKPPRTAETPQLEVRDYQERGDHQERTREKDVEIRPRRGSAVVAYQYRKHNTDCEEDHDRGDNLGQPSPEGEGLLHRDIQRSQSVKVDASYQEDKTKRRHYGGSSVTESQDSIALLCIPDATEKNDFGKSAASGKQMSLSGLLLRGLAAPGRRRLTGGRPEPRPLISHRGNDLTVVTP